MFAIPFPGTVGCTLMNPSFLHPGELAAASLKPTIRRTTGTHHGGTLLLLGHAAEHLASSRRFAFEETGKSSDDEAVHILMSLSRDVFEEYAGGFQNGGDGSGLEVGVGSPAGSN
jgi:hypothetical protein